MSETLKKSVAIVTGGSKGYGLGIAGALKRCGADVWITGRDQKALDAAVKELGVHAIQADVASGKDWDRVFDTVTRAHGRLDILVNNAGAGIRIAPVSTQTDADIEQSIAVNLTGAMFGCRRAAGIMMKQKSGIMVNISSVCACYAWPGWGVYSAAKAGLGQFSKSLYAEVREHGVRVTTVIPSWGATEFVGAADLAGHPANKQEVRDLCMQPREMGEVVVHVCEMPAHLNVLEYKVLPTVQEIMPL